MNRAPTSTNNHAWIGLAIAFAAAIVSLHWYRSPPLTTLVSTPSSSPSAAAPGDVREAQRAMLTEIRALVEAQRMDEARAQAAAYYEKWPEGPDGAELDRLTGVRRR